MGAYKTYISCVGISCFHFCASYIYKNTYKMADINPRPDTLGIKARLYNMTNLHMKNVLYPFSPYG